MKGDHERGCKMAGSYTVTTCPCCGAKITPKGRRWPGPVPYAQVVEAALRERPSTDGVFDVDGNRADGLGDYE